MIFVVTFVAFSIALAAMAVGVMFARSPISGSCGGLSKIEGIDCGICKNRHKCKRQRKH